MVDASLRDTVALSCDIDPGHCKDHDLPDGPLLTEFERRFQVISNLMDNHVIKTRSRSNGGRFFKYVILASFGSWADRAGWDIPLEFPRELSRQPAKAPDPEPTLRELVAIVDEMEKADPAEAPRKSAETLATKERTNLLVIIGGLAHKAGVNLTRPTVAAKEIARIVREDLKSKISARTVEEHIKKVAEALDRKAPDDE